MRFISRLVVVVATFVVAAAACAQTPTTLIGFDDDPTHAHTTVTFDVETQSNGIVPCTVTVVVNNERRCEAVFSRTAAQNIRVRAQNSWCDHDANPQTPATTCIGGWSPAVVAPIVLAGQAPGLLTIRGVGELPSTPPPTGTHMSIALVGPSENDFYFRSSNLPLRTAFTIGLWVKPTAYSGAFASVMAYENAGGSAGNYLGFNPGTGEVVIYGAGGSETPVRAGSLDQWVYLAMTGNGTTLTAYTRREGETTLVDVALTQDAFTVVDWYINTDSFDEILTAKYRHARIWGAVLSEAELILESASSTPVRTSNINGAYPMSSLTDDNEDQSGTGFNNSSNGTPAVDAGDDPSISIGGGGGSFRPRAIRPQIYVRRKAA